MRLARRTAAERKRALTCKRVQRLRKPERENRRNPVAYPVPLDRETLNAVVRWNWLTDDKATNKKQVGCLHCGRPIVGL